MDSLRCLLTSFQIWLSLYGNNTSKRSLATSRNRPLQNSNAGSTKLSSIVKTSRLPLCGSYFQAIETSKPPSWMHRSLPPSLKNIQEQQEIATSLVSALHRQYGMSYPWAIGKGRQLPSGYIMIYPGEEEKIVSKWSTHHLLRGLAFPTDAQHLGQINIPTHSGGVPRPLRVRRYTLFVPSCRKLRLMETSFSSGWFLHQH